MPFIDLHCDTIARLLACQRAGHPAHLRTGEPLHVNLEKLRRSGYLLQAFALFVNLHGTPAPAGVGGDPLYAQSMAARPEDPLEEVLTLADLYWTELAQNRDLARPVLTFQDLVEARQAGQIGCLLTVEEGGVCRGSLPLLRTLYRLGVRILTLTWNYPQPAGHPQRPGRGPHRDRLRLPGGDGGPGDAPRRLPPLRRGLLGRVPGRPAALPGQPLQRPGPVAPPAEPHRRDAPGPGGTGAA